MLERNQTMKLTPSQKVMCASFGAIGVNFFFILSQYKVSCFMDVLELLLLELLRTQTGLSHRFT